MLEVPDVAVLLSDFTLHAQTGVNSPAYSCCVAQYSNVLLAPDPPKTTFGDRKLPSGLSFSRSSSS